MSRLIASLVAQEADRRVANSLRVRVGGPRTLLVLLPWSGSEDGEAAEDLEVGWFQSGEVNEPLLSWMNPNVA